MVTQENLEKLARLREKVFAKIKEILAEDGHCKSYEGTFGIVFPDYFGSDWKITFDCYLIGPARHCAWSGETFEVAFDKAENDIAYWLNNY